LDSPFHQNYLYGIRDDVVEEYHYDEDIYRNLDFIGPEAWVEMMPTSLPNHERRNDD